MSTRQKLEQELLAVRNTAKAAMYARFFKTAKGEYGEGDQFLGLTVPQQRLIAKKYYHLSLADLQKMLNSSYHEYRFTALAILVKQYCRADKITRREIIDFYLKNTTHINNWDLVDISAPKIVGHWLLNHDRTILFHLAKSALLWERRIAVLSTYAFIKENQLDDTLQLAEILLNDKHDLIHKAVGWMLRELGKKDRLRLEMFLQTNAAKMPRTMLRYAIEKLPEEKRQFYLAK